jgi:hypothetical protein
MNYIQLKTSDIKTIKRELLEKQGFKDAITGKDLDEEHSVLDHQHKLRKSQPIGEDGAGLVRGVLDRQVNVAEGKICNALRRYCGICTVQERIDFLEKLVYYYRMYKTSYIHPSEKPSEPKVSKRLYNQKKKVYETMFNRKFPDYPKSGKMTKDLEKCWDKC